MKILGLCEGARADSGGMGIVAVPEIHIALSRRRHHVSLAIGGHPMRSALPTLTDHLEDVLDAASESAFGTVEFPAFGRWCYSPRLYGAAAGVMSRVDFVTLHSVFSYPVIAGYLLAQRHHKPYGLWPHGVLAPFQRSISRRRKTLYDLVVSRRILNSAAVIFFTARGEREEARALGLTAPSVVVPHGINIQEFENLPPGSEFRHKYLGGGDGPLVLFLARLNAKKGIDLLIEAMARVRAEIPNVKLVLAGSGDPAAFVTEVQRWLNAAGLAEATVLTGLLKGRDRLAAFAACDLFVMPSIAENFGCSLFEAMASRRAVVCSETINYAEEVRRWDAGLVVPREPEALADAIATLLRDHNRRAKLADNGLALAAEYSWDVCGIRVETAIQCVIAGQPFPSDLQPE
jgi:glycosyltransferase involved in cell wall biosynthesis